MNSIKSFIKSPTGTTPRTRSARLPSYLCELNIIVPHACIPDVYAAIAKITAAENAKYDRLRKSSQSSTEIQSDATTKSVESVKKTRKPRRRAAKSPIKSSSEEIDMELKKIDLRIKEGIVANQALELNKRIGKSARKVAAADIRTYTKPGLELQRNIDDGTYETVLEADDVDEILSAEQTKPVNEDESWTTVKKGNKNFSVRKRTLKLASESEYIQLSKDEISRDAALRRSKLDDQVYKAKQQAISDGRVCSSRGCDSAPFTWHNHKPYCQRCYNDIHF